MDKLIKVENAPKNPSGRPLKVIDWEQVEKLCEMQCTGEEVGAFIGLDYKTLERAIRREFKQGFVEYYKKHSGTGKTSLRRMQWLSAQGGNVTMLIWLGKQWLGQKDKTDISSDGSMSPVAARGDAVLAILKAEQAAAEAMLAKINADKLSNAG